MTAARRRRYHRATLEALLRHLAQPGHSTKTYLATHPRVTPEQIDAIFEDLRAAVDRVAAETTDSGRDSDRESTTYRRTQGDA